MIEAEIDARERTVEVSPATLGKVFPQLGPIVDPVPRSRVARLAGWLKIRFRLLFARLRFRMAVLRPVHCRIVQWRLRAKLTWLKIRQRRSLMRPR